MIEIVNMNELERALQLSREKKLVVVYGDTGCFFTKKALKALKEKSVPHVFVSRSRFPDLWKNKTVPRVTFGGRTDESGYAVDIAERWK